MRAVFDRIGRNHAVPPLDLTGDPVTWAAQIYNYARPHLGSRDVEVILEQPSPDDPISGFILCGWNNGGSFSVEAAS